MKAICNKSTSMIEGHAQRGDIAHDPTTHIVVTVDHVPDPETERWDGAEGVRPATPAELIADAEAQKNIDAVEIMTSPLGLACIEEMHSIMTINGLTVPDVATLTANVQAKVRAKL